MTDQIKPGDLVMVVKPTPCCGNEANIGRIAKVKNVANDSFLVCVWCERLYRKPALASLDGGRVLLSRLKKLNPPADEESRETTKELEVV